jgi:hypothetical protein
MASGVIWLVGCEGWWCFLEPVSWVVVILGFPAALLGIKALLNSLKGPEIEVGFAHEIDDGTGVVNNSVARARENIQVRLGSRAKNSQILRNLHLSVGFKDLAEANLDPADGEVQKHTGDRIRWVIDEPLLLPDLTLVSELSIKNVPTSMKEVEINVWAIAEGLRRSQEYGLKLALPEPTTRNAHDGRS